MTKWLTFVQADASLEEFFAEVYIPFTYEFLAARGDAATGNVTVTRVFNIPATPPHHMYHVAVWSPNGGFTWSTFKFLHKNVDLQGAVIRGVYIKDVSGLCILGS